MGTRGITQVNMGNKPVVAQYGQWDHYPSGQGITALNFLRRRKGKFDTFKKKLSRVRFATDEDDKKMTEYLNSIGSINGWVTMEQSTLYNKKYPYLSRDHGARILDLINKSTKKDDVLLVDDSTYPTNEESFGCEGVYTIDFDKNTFTANYHGHEKIYQLDDLPTQKQFLKDMKDPEDE